MTSLNKKIKIFMILSILIVFCLGIIVGVFGERSVFHRKPFKQADRRPPYPTFESMARELGLTEDQQGKIREIFNKNEESFKILRSELHKKLGEMRLSLKEEIDKILTPEQKSKFEAIIREHEKQRQAAMKKQPQRDFRREQGDRSREQNRSDNEKGDVK